MEVLQILGIFAVFFAAGLLFGRKILPYLYKKNKK